MNEENKMSLEEFKKLMKRQEKRKENFFLWGGRIHTPFHHLDGPEFGSHRYYRNFLTTILREGIDLGSCYGTPFIKTNLGLLYSDYGEQGGGYSAYFTRRKESITIFESDMDFMKELAKRIKASRNMRCLDNEFVVSEMEKIKSVGREGNCLFELNMGHSQNWNVKVNGKEIPSFRERETEYRELAELINPLRILPNLVY